MFAFKPDFETTYRRMEAFWERDVFDRPLVSFHLLKPVDQLLPLPPSHHPDSAARWLDVQYQAEFALANLSNQEFLGDTLPIAFPNLGPELFSAFYGCPLHFGEFGTSWSDPVLHDWAQAPELVIDWNHPYLLKLHEMTDALLEIGKGKFITGMTDWHPGGDALAAFRDPQELAIDMITAAPQIKVLLEHVARDYYKIYDIFYEKLRAAGQPITSWTPLCYFGRYYIPSNDFSIMISKKMFDEFFLPGIAEECRFLDRSIYHLDGPGALRHLDSLLSIPELDAVQFVPGSGNEGYYRWVDVYRRIQAAGKSMQVNCDLTDLPLIMETLRPEGVYLSLSGILDREMAEDVLKALEKWTAQSNKDR